MQLYKQWHRPRSKWFIKLSYSISRATSIDSDCCRLPTTSVLSKKTENYAPEGFNDWGGGEYDDFVPGEVTKIDPSGDETT